MTHDGPAAAGPSRRDRLVSAARVAYTLLLVLALAWALVLARDDVAALARDARPAFLVGALLAGVGMPVLTSALWSSMLRALGSSVPAHVVLSATARSLPARYLPGSIWYAVSRGALLRERGVPVRALTTVATLEMLLVPVVGFAVGGFLLAVSGGTPSGLTAPLVVAAVALAVLATPPVLNRLLALVWRSREGAPPAVDWPAVARLVGWITLFWVWSASVFALYLAGFPRVADDVPVATLLGAYMVAWGVGWLAVFAPQGVGVFEVTLASALGTATAGTALVLGGYRVVVLARDLLLAAVAAALHRRTAHRR
ncbi:MAG: lysylphosphatidylglycerol synthase domain-containing protein [Actinomycetota bacterium]|nr:lysylphosphatidylglycerol synthase domain-containing protein [Actinomycetota bacterium]